MTLIENKRGDAIAFDFGGRTHHLPPGRSEVPEDVALSAQFRLGAHEFQIVHPEDLVDPIIAEPAPVIPAPSGAPVITPGAPPSNTVTDPVTNPNPAPPPAADPAVPQE
jgi:hypothetical protein